MTRRRTKLGSIESYEDIARQRAMSASTIPTIEACDAILVEISDEISDLETELEDAIAHRRRTKAEPTSEEKADFYSARRSLKINRLGLTAVQQRRGLLIAAAKAEYQRDRNRRLLDLLNECNPSVFWWLLETAASRWPDEFSSPGRKDHKNGPDADHHVGSTRPGPTVDPGVCPHDP